MYKGVTLNNINSEELENAKKHEANGVFVYSNNLSDENIKKIKEFLGNIEINAILKCFEGKDLQGKFPEAIPVDKDNKPVNDTDYYPVSPLNEDVRKYLIDEVKRIIELPITNFWLDQFQFATKWNVIEPEILDTDYSDASLKMFEDYIGEPIVGATLEDKYLHIDGSYYHEWLQFKSNALVSFLSTVKETIAASGKQISVGFFAVPWEEGDYGAGIKRIVAQHFDTLSLTADKIAIQLPYESMHKDIDWIKTKIAYFWQLGRHFICILEEGSKLDEAIEAGSISPSEGVVLKPVD